ncbi:MAG: cupin domain-containing protein [Candidatus Binatia bacterium]|nr:cupin domain-containing protein [Candidatus Binatia bacterium]
MPVKIMRIEDAPIKTEGNLDPDRGKCFRLVDERDGARNVDVHLNLLNPGSRLGPRHIHKAAENVYIVLEGTVEVEVEGQSHRLRQGEVAFIPPGVPHAVGNAGDVPAKFIEIYAPAGKDYHPYPNN